MLPAMTWGYEEKEKEHYIITHLLSLSSYVIVNACCLETLTIRVDLQATDSDHYN
jgi:hypothetical protein